MAPFSYGPFSEPARDAVVTATHVALDEGSKSVLPEHLEAAVGGAPRGDRPDKETYGIPFDPSTKAVVERAHDAALAAGEEVELQHLRRALDKDS